MKGELSAADFPVFFEAVHGFPPFPWQRRLAERVLEEGWPAALGAPTGAGKTAAIDVAVFHLAVEASRHRLRRAPVRIIFVVDRRLVVDDAYQRAERIATAIAKREGPILRQVADALASFAESPEKPLSFVRLRGGMPREPDWVRTPSQPTIVISTLDQVGSRLLFRGYGVSRSMRPVHAGLLGRDSLWILDEAHLAHPFVETLRAVMEREPGGMGSPKASRPPSVVTLSATQRSEAESFLSEDDRQHPELGLRLAASKPAELVAVREVGRAFEEECVRRALGFSRLGGGEGNVVAVVVNRIATARRIYSRLGEAIAGLNGMDADRALLIGRTRDLDRKSNLEALLPRMRAADRSDGAPLFVVATQTVEAGADLDFDALVTEAAPLDALRQRFGRLNRMGWRPIARAAIVARDKDVAARAKPDPLYGEATKRTWAWIHEAATVEGRGKSARRILDFGVQASAAWLPTGDALDQCIAPLEVAPVLLPAFVERWSRTSPRPVDDPEVALFLHGPRAGPADVQIVWRADLSHEEPRELAIERIAACPPSALEAMTVPFGAARRWLAGESADDFTDLVAAATDGAVAEGKVQVLRWRGAADAATGWITSRALRPGDTIVVPAAMGGCDRWGWNPKSREPVGDLGEEANHLHRRMDVLRLSAARLATEGAREQAPSELDPRAFVMRLEALADESDDEVLREISTWREIPERWRESLALGRGRVVRSEHLGGVPIAIHGDESMPDDPVTEDDGSSVSTVRTTLRAHARGVEAVARQFASAADLPEHIAADVELAAFLHDAGKAAPAFQQWLHGGDELAAAAGEPLAKSPTLRLDAAARVRSKLPMRARHEVASLQFALAHPRLSEANDPDLVLWLVGTHHGWGRPFFPPVEWPPPGSTFRADLGDRVVAAKPAPTLAELTGWWIDMRERLQDRYGRWGLAHLEAILRLADHRRSEAERKEGSR